MPRKATIKKPKQEKLAPSLVQKVVIPVVENDDTPAIDEVKFAAASDAAKEKYFEAVGRRKESVARVRLYTRKSTDQVQEDKALITVNGKDYAVYFTNKDLVAVIEAPLRKLKSLSRFKATVVVRGGGSSGQAEAIRHGIARALEHFDSNFRKKLKKSGLLKRDPRAKERRKYGHKKARKSGRWSKR
ncbi:MAG: 30S ribosomal protein S9 [Patescibacteria group bacterium]